MGRPLALSVVLVSALAAAACSERRGAADAGATDAAVAVGLAILPEAIQLTSVDGATVSMPLRAMLTTADGRRSLVEPSSWSSSDERVGAVDAGGVFRATGRAGGRVTITARYTDAALGPLVASATIDVRLDLTLLPAGGVPAAVLERLRTLPSSGADPFEAAAIEYPLDGARMPNNVGAPVVQWYPRERAGDGFRVVLETEHAIVRGFAYDDGRSFRSSWPVEPAAWRALADSARGAEISVRVDRLAAGASALELGEPVTIWLSEDGVFGTLYYWEVRTDPQASDVLRLDAVGGSRRSVLGSGDGTCVGCHSLSADGRRLAAATDARGSTWVTAVLDAASATTPPPDLLAPLSPALHFLAFSPDGSRILASRARDTEATEASELQLLDGATGAPVPDAIGLPAGPAGYPAWSPDGAWVAWMAGGGDGTRGTSASTRIEIAPVLGPSELGAPAVLHEGVSLEGALEGGATDARPTWSPDASLLAFSHGTRSVSATDIGEPPPTAGLYVVSREGGPSVRLDRGMGRTGPADAFWPVFSPFVTEESDGTRLFWLAFYSRGDYGNDREGTAGSGRRQLWVMAIDPDRLAAGEDPSSPPYWLPGQDTRADDIAALWAPRACRTRGETCSASSECCSGECAAADPAQPDVLSCLPPRVCRPFGESCELDADCCEGICNLGVCGYEPPF